MDDALELRPLMTGSLLRRLRDEILSHPPGMSLGTETEIANRFSVGRATLRQAARILEREQLITVLRGAKGGYVTRRPDVNGIGRAATLYLSLRRATLKHLSVASRVLNVEVYRLAAMSNDEEKREILRKTIEELRNTSHPDMTVSEFLKRGEKIRNCILELADNPFLELFLRIVYFFGARMPSSIFTDAPERMERQEARQWRVGEAILNREPEVTAALNAEGWRMIESWLEPYEGAQAVEYVEEPKAKAGRKRKRREAA